MIAPHSRMCLLMLICRPIDMTIYPSIAMLNSRPAFNIIIYIYETRMRYRRAHIVDLYMSLRGQLVDLYIMAVLLFSQSQLFLFSLDQGLDFLFVVGTCSSSSFDGMRRGFAPDQAPCVGDVISLSLCSAR